MKEKHILGVFGQVDEEYIEQAASTIGKSRKIKKQNWVKLATMAACLCLVVVGSFLYNSFKPGDFNSMISKGTFDTTMTMTTIPVDEQIACYQQIDIDGKKLEKFVGTEYLKTGALVWYIPEGTDNLKYLICKDADNTLTLWMFTSFETSEGETYTYGDVLTIIYGVHSTADIVSITTSPIRSNNIALGKEIQNEVGTKTYTDLEDISLFYNIANEIICYGVCNDNPADNTRFTYSFSTDENDKLTSGESTYGTRCISIEFADGTILDSWKYSALSGSFFEYGGIFTEPLEESDVYELNELFGIK